MEYIKKEVKCGVNTHFIKTTKFKTNLVACFLTVPLTRETITYNALIPAVLRRGTASIPTMKDISIKLEELYGSSFDCGVEKRGDNLVIKFYIESVNEKYLGTNQKVLLDSVSLILDVAFNPFLENGYFKKEYVESEKKTIRQLIESRIDNKDSYALTRATEVMFQNYPYSIYKYGYIEDLGKINEISLYEHYKKVIDTAKIDIYISGDFNEIELEENVSKQLSNFNEREDKIVSICEPLRQENIESFEKMELQQTKLVIGLRTSMEKENFKSLGVIYNTILGGSSNSKLFRNVREKESLAYSIGSTFIYPKKTVLIKGGVELEKTDRAIEIIKLQLEDMENGEFTLEDINDAKKYIVNSLVSIKDSQSPMIDYYMSCNLFENSIKSIEEYIEEINQITKEEIIEFANNIKIDTIYLLSSAERSVKNNN